MKDVKKKKKLAWIIAIIVIAWLVIFSISSIFSDKKVISKNKIAVIPVIGEITTSGSSGFPLESGGASSTTLVKNLERAEMDESIKAIILEINSPGGTVVASEEVANKIKSIEKPVIAWIREIGTSGAYWIASSSDRIIADPLSITGSIGVIGSYLEFSKLMEKYGIGYEQLTTGKYKDIASPFRELSQEEKNLMAQKLNIIHEAFVDEVAINRKLPRENVASISTGLFYIGKEAKELGLVDELGGRELAINAAKRLAGIEDAELVRYEEKRSIFDLLGSVISYPSYYLGRGIGFELSQKIDKPGLSINAL